MKGFWKLLVLLATLSAIEGAVAQACYCGATRYCCCKRTCCQMQCCTVMKMCKEIVYEDKPCTQYRTVFEEVVEKVPVDAVKYVEETAYRCAPCTIYQPKQPATGPCAPAACASPCTCAETTPTQVLRKVPYTVMRPVSYQKMEERKRVVSKQVPYTITLCVPKEVYREVPVTVCCPVPCCRTCKPCAPTGCGG